MQYTVSDQTGNQYGPVDLKTLKQWVLEGRIMPDSKVTDNLSNVTLLASQMPELGVNATNNPNDNNTGYASDVSQYLQANSVKRGTRLWGIVFWLVLGLVFSMFSKYGGLFVSGWNIFDAIKAKTDDDPNAGLCLGIAISGFIVILIWTMLKTQGS